MDGRGAGRHPLFLTFSETLPFHVDLYRNLSQFWEPFFDVDSVTWLSIRTIVFGHRSPDDSAKYSDGFSLSMQINISMSLTIRPGPLFFDLILSSHNRKRVDEISTGC